jgi:hypothetical protein
LSTTTGAKQVNLIREKQEIRPKLAPDVVKGLQRYATAHSVNLTAAANLLLSKILKQEKYLEHK